MSLFFYKGIDVSYIYTHSTEIIWIEIATTSYDFNSKTEMCVFVCNIDGAVFGVNKQCFKKKKKGSSQVH